MALERELPILITEIEANVSHAESITHGLSHAQFNWRPEPGRWSIAECLAHLNRLNGLELRAMRQAIEAGRAAGKTGEGPFEYGFISRKLLATIEPPVKRKFKASASYIPPKDSPLEATFAEYKRVSAELRKLAEGANGLHLKKVKTTVPAVPAILRSIIKMPLGARFQVVSAHDRRHLWQAEQVRQHPQFPKT